MLLSLLWISRVLAALRGADPQTPEGTASDDISADDQLVLRGGEMIPADLALAAEVSRERVGH